MVCRMRCCSSAKSEVSEYDDGRRDRGRSRKSYASMPGSTAPGTPAGWPGWGSTGFSAMCGMAAGGCERPGLREVTVDQPDHLRQIGLADGHAARLPRRLGEGFDLVG